jgi:hypothetical protein
MRAAALLIVNDLLDLNREIARSMRRCSGGTRASQPRRFGMRNAHPAMARAPGSHLPHGGYPKLLFVSGPIPPEKKPDCTTVRKAASEAGEEVTRQPASLF